MSTANLNSESISTRLRKVTCELRDIQQLLTSEDDVDTRILTDFRDAVNRVRNTAWAVEQYANSKTTETNPDNVLSVLAGERVRVAYQLCRLIENDLENDHIQFRKGQLVEFRLVTNQLGQKLQKTVGE